MTEGTLFLEVLWVDHRPGSARPWENHSKPVRACLGIP